MSATLTRSNKTLQLVALLAILLPMTTVQAQTIRTVATVNDEVITSLDVQARISLVLSGSPQNTPAIRAGLQDQVLDLLITEALQRQEAERLGINIPAAQVEESLIRIATRGGNSIEQFIAELERQGALVSTLRGQIASQLSWQAVIGRRFFTEDIVTDADISAEREILNQNVNLEERLLSEVYIPVSDRPSLNRALQSMRRIRTQVEGGANLGLLAQQFSLAPSALDGGDIGWVIEGTLDPAIERGLATVEVGGLSEVISAPGGVYLFAVRARRPVGKRVAGQQGQMLQLFFNLPANLEDVTAQQKLARAAAIIQSVKGCEQFASAISRFGETGSGDMGVVNFADLPPDLGRVATNIEVGQVTPPYPVPNGAALFMICERSAIQEPVTDSEIRDRLLERKLSGRATRLLRELRRRAFIDIRR